MNTNTKISRCRIFKIKIAATILFLAFLFVPTKAARAALWPGIDPNIKQMLENIQYRINGIILGMLKQQALTMLNQQVGSLVSGSSAGQVMFITDWEDYLVKQPEELTKIYMNDYWMEYMKGRGSLTGYRSEGFSGSSNSYANQLTRMVQQTVIDPKKPSFTYEGDPSQMFSDGTFKQLSFYIENSPWAIDTIMKNEKAKKAEDFKRIADQKSDAYSGFIGTGEKKDGTGQIITPGSVTKEAVTNAQDLGNKIIASATHPEEIISAIVSQIVTQAIQQGIGEVQSVIDREISGVQGKINSALGQSDPNAQYKDCYGKPEGSSCNGIVGICRGGLCVPK